MVQVLRGTLKSAETKVEHEYPMVDKSVKSHDAAPAPLGHTPPQLMHEQGAGDQGKSQS